MAHDRSLTTALAEYWTNVQYRDLPDEAIHAAKRFLLDTLAAGIAGASTDVAAAALEAMTASIEASPGQGSAVIWGRATRLPAPQAALVNGTAAHALEVDDFGGCGHSGAVVIPAVCATADLAGARGDQVLTAVVAGYDVAARVLDGAGGYRPHNERGWHSTGTCGSFGAAAGVARLLEFDAERFTHALGIAGTFTGGIWAYLADGAMTKRFHPGKAAENGLMAAMLARAGMTGPRLVLEAEWGGFFPTYSGTAAIPDATIADLGARFRILQSGIKPYACCRGLHGCIDSLLDCMASDAFDHHAIERVIAHGSEQTRHQFARHQVDSLLDAQFSLPYSLAVAAESGRATLDQYVPVRHDDPTIRGLMSLTDVAADRALAPEESPTLEIRLRDGRVLWHQTPFARGAPERPLSDGDVVEKAQSLIAPVLGDAKFRLIVSTISELEGLPDIRHLTALLQAAAAP